MSSPNSVAGRLRPLLGGRHRLVVALILTSVFAGLCEAAILATVAQAAASLVNGARSVRANVGPLHVTESVGGLLAIAFALAVGRLALQWPLSVIPARISAGVQASMQRSLFGAFTRASWTEQSNDREGHFQELVMNQVLQASWAALAVTGLVTSVLTLLVLVGSALLLNVVAAAAVLGATVLMFGLLRPLNQLIGWRSRDLSRAQMSMASGVGQAARLSEETHVFGVAAAQRHSIAAVHRYDPGALLPYADARTPNPRCVPMPYLSSGGGGSCSAERRQLGSHGVARRCRAIAGPSWGLRSASSGWLSNVSRVDSVRRACARGGAPVRGK